MIIIITVNTHTDLDFMQMGPKLNPSIRQEKKRHKIDYCIKITVVLMHILFFFFVLYILLTFSYCFLIDYVIEMINFKKGVKNFSKLTIN